MNRIHFDSRDEIDIFFTLFRIIIIMDQDTDQELIKSQINISLLEPFVEPQKSYVNGKLTTNEMLVYRDGKLVMRELPIIEK